MNTTPLEEFRKISAVPRRSFHHEKIIAYCMERAKELGLFCYYDEAKENVLIRKPAVAGKEDRPGVVLQGHLDMVPQEDAGVNHDWENEGLELLLDGDTLTANGTTLGADNGVAAAIAFALLADDTLKNPPLEVLLTTGEEVGMLSVKDADLSYVQGKYLFNLDGGVEGEFVTGCCGGMLLRAAVKEEREEADGAAYRITVTGLKGGHSGIEIGTERANALKVLGQVLFDIGRKFDFRITDIRAEGKDNAISKEAGVDIVVLTEHVTTDMALLITETEKKLQQIFRLTDPQLSIKLQTLGSCREKADTFALNKKATDALSFLLMQLPFGVLHHDQSLDGSIETSCNLGLIVKDEGQIMIVISVRSSVAERSLEVVDLVRSLCEAVGAQCVKTEKEYPAWLPDPKNPLVPLFRDTFVSLYGKEPVTGPIHAGLECGYILANSGIEAAISTGPNITGEHTTAESLSVSSLSRTFDFMKAVIERV